MEHTHCNSSHASWQLTSCALQGRAHVLLEQYSQAQQVFLEGMAGKLGLSDPVQAQLQQALRQVSSFAAASRSGPGQPAILSKSLQHAEPTQRGFSLLLPRMCPGQPWLLVHMPPAQAEHATCVFQHWS